MSLIQTILDLLFPPRCLFCQKLCSAGSTGEHVLPPWGENGVTLKGVLCSDCAAATPWLLSACPRCAQPLPLSGLNCIHCLEKPFAFDNCCALGSYRDELRKTLHRFKYHGEKALAVPLGRLLASRLAVTPWFPGIDLLVPVPLAPTRRRSRGYNQAALLAEEVGRQLALPVQTPLQRIRDTDSQTELGRAERWHNMFEAFRYSGGEAELQGKNILIVDDILTSGATAHAAAQVLLEAGAGVVSVAVIAR